MSPVDVVEEVLRKHRPYGLDCKCGVPINSDDWWANHAAPLVIEALNLTEQRRTNVMSSCGQTTDYRTGVTTSHSDIRYDHRFVTEWSPL